jgi:pimeloyl-ACP methyl ester carboxylesterase
VRFALRGVQRQSRLIERGRARLGDAAWVFVRRLAFGPHVDPALVEFVARMIATTPVDVIAEFYPSLNSHDKLAALDVLRDVPAVIVCGENDLITPPEHSREMADYLPKAELVLVPGAGHQVLMERPDLVNPALLRLVGEALRG